MAGRQIIRAQGNGSIQQRIELNMLIAFDAGIGRFPLR